MNVCFPNYFHYIISPIIDKLYRNKINYQIFKIRYFFFYINLLFYKKNKIKYIMYLK